MTTPKTYLESISKTTNEILIYVHDITGFIGIVPNQGAKVAEYGLKKWVPLAEAESLETLKNNWMKHAEDEQHAHIQLSLKIEQILDMAHSNWAETGELEKRLREALKQ